MDVVIGLTGPNASGKGEVAAHLGSRGFSLHSLSDIVREQAAQQGFPPEREFLIRVGNALRRVDSQLEEAARVLGASPRTIGRRIVIPLLLPALASAVLLTASKVLGTFGTPYVLGLPVRYTVLSTSLYDSYGTGDIGTTAVLSVVIIALGIGLLVADLWLLREYRRFVTVGTKGALVRSTRLGAWRMPLSVAAATPSAGERTIA